MDVEPDLFADFENPQRAQADYERWAEQWAAKYDEPIESVLAPDSVFNYMWQAAAESDWDRSVGGRFWEFLHDLGYDISDTDVGPS